MGNLMLSGGRLVNLAELQGVALPEATPTYTPVSFSDLMKNTQDIADKILGYEGWVFDESQIGLARNDQRMFATLRYKKETESTEHENDLGFSLGIRSSYDKSMSNGFCAGAQVFVCSNLMFTGDITYMRKHTKNVYNDLEQNILQILYKSQQKFDDIQKDKDVMEQVDLKRRNAYQLLGELMGYKVLQARQAKKAYKHWDDPPHNEFAPRNMWSFYNSCTEALKSTQPNKIIENHIQLHDFTMNMC